MHARRRLGLTQEQLASPLNVSAQALQNWEARRRTGQLNKKTKDLRDLLSRMDDYVVTPKENKWLSAPLPSFSGRSPRELITEGRICELVVEFNRLSEAQPV